MAKVDETLVRDRQDRSHVLHCRAWPWARDEATSQHGLWIAASDLPTSPGHPFYDA